MSDGPSLIICGDCHTTHDPSTPPLWEETEGYIQGHCVECEAVIVRVPRELE